MRLFRHGDKEKRFEVGYFDAFLFGQRMTGRQNDHDIMAGDAFPSQSGRVLAGDGRTQADKTEVNFARFQGAKLFGRRHVEEVDGDLRAGLIEGGQVAGRRSKLNLNR